MRTIFYLWLFAIALSSCTSIKEIGKVTMIATRNVESNTEYGLITSYAGSGKKILKRNKAKTIEQAIDNVVRSVPGGEFLKNVKMYRIGDHYAVEGDVWGTTKDISFQGWHKGDNVQWKSNFKTRKGQIVSLKDDKVCIVKETESGNVSDVRYENLIKTE